MHDRAVDKREFKIFLFGLQTEFLGTRVMKEDKPRSKVIPRSLDYGLSSRLAVNVI